MPNLVQKTLDNIELEGFKVGDLVKWIKPYFEIEIDRIMLIKWINKDTRQIGLTLPNKKSFFAITYTDQIKKVK